MKAKKETVRILGQEVTVGTKKHAKLVAQVKYFNDLSNYEKANQTNRNRNWQAAKAATKRKGHGSI